MPQWIEVY
ncbi:unnamed protein product [Timema podura]|uniref:Uncharacterized protein n=1 Tax=Timema podura TaxID=61482 RepID=A0ABN7PFA4_TIMPD|nr:unnamed protein product [Timema podura]